MHWFNDRSKTAGNLQPYYTSTVDVKYIGRLYNDEAFDSSYLLTETYGDSIYRTKVTAVISGWTIALQEMHVGDSVEVIIPYQSAYGLSGSGTAVLPFSNLKFNIKLVDIPYWEINQ
jgi:FKBP-type peptidyl-prolyl cis-trans isomerase FklB